MAIGAALQVVMTVGHCVANRHPTSPFAETAPARAASDGPLRADGIPEEASSLRV
jgi:hypothetical protein